MKTMNNIVEFLKGKKTYVLGTFALASIGLGYLGLLDWGTVNTILLASGFGSILTLRAAIAKITV